MRDLPGWLAAVMALAAAWSVHAADFGYAVAMKDSGRHTYHVPVTLGALPAQRFLLDTGSSHSTIDSDTLAELQRSGEARYMGNLLGTMADGTERRVPVYLINRVTIGESCVVRDVKAAVLPGADRNILGLSVLRRLAPFSVTTQPPTLHFSGCGSMTTVLDDKG